MENIVTDCDKAKAGIQECLKTPQGKDFIRVLIKHMPISLEVDFNNTNRQYWLSGRANAGELLRMLIDYAQKGTYNELFAQNQLEAMKLNQPQTNEEEKTNE